MFAMLYMLISTNILASPNNFGVPVFNPDRKEVLAFHKRAEKVTAGGSLIEIEFRDAAGKLLFFEVGELQAGRVRRFEVHQNQLNQRGVVNIGSDIILFEYHENGSLKKSKAEVNNGKVVAPIELTRFIKDNIALITKDKSLQFRIPVWDRLETFGMDLILTDGGPFEKTKNSKIIKMTPSNFFVAKFVNPIFFYFDTTEGKVTKSLSRLPIKKINRGKVVDLEGLLLL